MRDHTLEIPTEHVEAFRKAVAAEIASDAEWVNDVGQSPADVRGATACLTADLAVQKQLEDAGDPVAVTADAATLAHLAEMMLVMTDGLIGQYVETTPMEGETATSVRYFLVRATWAVEVAERFHGIATDERGRA